MTANIDGFQPLKVTKKSGEEQFHEHGRPLGTSLLDFWRWSISDLVGNTARGILAEYIVAQALNLTSGTRTEWEAFDLVTPDGLKIEVKSASYLQSWYHKKLSAIRFTVRPTRSWDAAVNELSSEVKRQADVYIFCVLKHLDKATLDPLNLDQWDFYVLEASVLNDRLPGQKTVGLNSLLRLGPIKVSYAGLAECIQGLHRKNSD